MGLENNRRRVVVTGIGLISPVGIGIEENWSNLIAGKSGIGPITRFDSSAFATHIAGEVKNFHPEEFISKKELRKMDPFLQFALGAARYAMEDAELKIEPEISSRVGVVMGCGLGGLLTIEESHKLILEIGSQKSKPIFHSDDYQQYGPWPHFNLPRRKRSQPFLADCMRGRNSRHRSGLSSNPGRVCRSDDHRGRRVDRDHPGISRL